jgi:Transposase DDE domain
MDRERTSGFEREQWQAVVSAVKRAARRLPKPRRRPRYPDRLVVAMFLWAVWHDRCLSWACDRSHYGALFRPRKLPSVSQFTRRIKSPRCRQILQWVHEDLAETHLASPVSYLDGKPLLVSPVSKDRDARRGRVSGGFAKGYKLHAWATEDGRIPLFSVTGLHAGECPVAEALCALLPPLGPCSVVLADTNYDDRDLHKALAARGGVLVSPIKGEEKYPATQPRHPVTLRQMGPGRRELLDAWAETPGLVRFVLRGRVRVENIFSRVAFGGLGHLPPFVRGTSRVTRWTGAKLILYHALLRIRRRRQRAA